MLLLKTILRIHSETKMFSVRIEMTKYFDTDRKIVY